MNFNMNDNFSVTLTEFGANKYTKWANMYPHPSVPVAEFKEGYSMTKPLWEIFNIFGQDMFLGAAEMPFKDNQIRAQDAGIDFDKNTQIAIVWSIEDVQGQDDSLTDAEAMNVLDVLEDKHDANYGISWETIDITIGNLYPNGGSK